MLEFVEDININKKYSYDATLYPDVQELLAASDILVTDYSSLMFDFLLQYKPGFLFTTDLKHYEKERGFYYPLSSVPSLRYP